MSKSLNFVLSIGLDKRSSNANGDYPIKLRVWNRASKKVKLYSCNKFTDSTSFQKAINQGTTVKGETFKLRVYLDRVLSNARLFSHQSWLEMHLPWSHARGGIRSQVLF